MRILPAQISLKKLYNTKIETLKKERYMMVCYKIITKNRDSSIAAGTPFNLKYIKGKTVTAHKGTCGIFVFRTKAHAMKHLQLEKYKIATLTGLKLEKTIIKVAPIGERQKIKVLAFPLLSLKTKEEVLNLIETAPFSAVPDGTEVYQSVKVLE